MRTRLVPIVAPVMFRIPAVRAFLFGTVSQTGIRYPKSPLSEGRSGRLSGGDRLPWTGEPSDQGNFKALTSLKWQVHVYGEARPDAAEACKRLGLALHVFAWSARAQVAGLTNRALYLVRPDGYIALIEATGKADGLEGYLDRQGLRLC
jgi:hypothetical protein